MRIVKREEMRNIDKRAVKEFGIPSIILMENAGRGVVEVMEEYLNPLEEKKILVIAGKGNNGGDGFVVARHAKNKGANVKTILLGEKKEITGDAKINLNIAEKAGIEIERFNEENAKTCIKEADVVVDAIFGTGFKGAPTGNALKAIQLINEYASFIISVDVPSGVEADGGTVKDAVYADVTATMGFLKPCHVVYPAREYCGDVWIVDIGIPEWIIEKEGNLFLNDFNSVKKILPYRIPYGNKGTFGKVLTIGGSPGMTGAPSLCAMAALRVGAGLSYLVYPSALSFIYESKLTEVVKIPVKGEKYFTHENIPEVLQIVENVDAVALGPGISTNENTQKFVKEIIKKIEKPLILDADGINCIKDTPSLLLEKENIILTPHPGELARLTGLPPKEIDIKRIEVAKKYAKRLNLILILKGASTVIASPEISYVNLTGNSGLASGGTGDVLTGMILGFLGQTNSLIDASRLAVFLHGLAADLAVKEKTEYGLIAGDLLTYIPKALKLLLEEENEEE